MNKKAKVIIEYMERQSEGSEVSRKQLQDALGYSRRQVERALESIKGVDGLPFEVSRGRQNNEVVLKTVQPGESMESMEVKTVQPKESMEVKTVQPKQSMGVETVQPKLEPKEVPESLRKKPSSELSATEWGLLVDAQLYSRRSAIEIHGLDVATLRARTMERLINPLRMPHAPTIVAIEFDRVFHEMLRPIR
jgi:biotin operon repressor